MKTVQKAAAPDLGDAYTNAPNGEKVLSMISTAPPILPPNGAAQHSPPPPSGLDDPDSLESLAACENGDPAPTPTPEPTPSAPRWRPAVDRLADLIQSGARLATGFASLDRATRGGLRPGRRVIVGGPPGAGKTTLAVGMVWRWAEAGYHVAIVATDEPLPGIVMRIGQAIGLDRDDLEEEARTGHAEAMATLRARFAALGERLLLVDGDDEIAEGVPVTVEAVSAELARRRTVANGIGSVLTIDSVQTAATAETATAANPKDRVDAVLAAVRRAACRDGHLIIATSEVNRASYAAKNTADRINDIASFKESGGIEFKADLCIMLRPVEGTDFVDATLPKNRLRGLDAIRDFRIELNRSRATFAEVALPSEQEREAEADARADAMRARIIEAITKAAVPIASANQLRDRCGAIKPRIRARDAAWNATAKEMVAEGLVLHSRKLGYHLPAPPSATDAGRCRTDAASVPEERCPPYVVGGASISASAPPAEAPASPAPASGSRRGNAN